MGGTHAALAYVHRHDLIRHLRRLELLRVDPWRDNAAVPAAVRTTAAARAARAAVDLGALSVEGRELSFNPLDRTCAYTLRWAPLLAIGRLSPDTTHLHLVACSYVFAPWAGAGRGRLCGCQHRLTLVRTERARAAVGVVVGVGVGVGCGPTL